MRIAVCDDNVKDQEQFTKALKGWDPTRTPECYCNGASLLEAARKPDQEYIGIVFLDIYMPGENGVEIAKELKHVSPKTGIVFLTTSEEHAVDAFFLHALHYLVKPVTTEGVVEAFARLTQHTGRKRPMISLSVGHENRTVYLDEICYIQSANHATEVFLSNGKQIRIWTPLNKLEEKLDETFLKVNRSAVVNMEQIEQMGIDSCLLRDGTRLDFARRERSAIRAAYDNFLFSRLAERKGFGEEVGI